MAVDVSFDSSLHSVDAIQRAAYKYCTQFSLEIRQIESSYACTLRFADENCDPGPIVEDFRTEVLDQVLRERIRNETEATRNLILALAFSKTNLQQE